MFSSVTAKIGDIAVTAKEKIKDLISPPRVKYDLSTFPRVLKTGEDFPFNQNYVRTHLELVNERGIKLVGSLYKLETDANEKLDTCLVYLHGVSSSQLEGQFLVPNFCNRHIAVFCFDFAGCGCSDGKCISLGYFEHLDAEAWINKLASDFGFKKFALWGRSMGAATALLVNHPSVTCAVVDSAYSSVEDVMSSVAAQYYIPKVVFLSALKLYVKSLFTEDFDLYEVSPLKAVSSCVHYPVACAFGHAKEDKFVPYEEGKLLFDSLKNDDKRWKELPGGHNSHRDYRWIQYGVAFILNHFGFVENEEDLDVCECRKLQEGTEQFESFSALIQSQKPPVEDEPEKKEEAKEKPKKQKTKKEGEEGEKKHKHHSKTKDKTKTEKDAKAGENPKKHHHSSKLKESAKDKPTEEKGPQ